MKYTYSRLSSDSVMQLIKLHYDLSEPINCIYYVFGLHDNYLITNNEGKFIFRIYRNDWRTEEEILFELELLSYLKNKSTKVAAPVLTNSSRLNTSIESPEGKRIAALFNYAKGISPESNISLEECSLLGNSVAKIHEDTINFKTQYTRPILDLSYLVGRSLTLIKPCLNSEQIKYLLNIQEKIQTTISNLISENSDFGICIGDVNPTNFHIDEEKIITIFDFDQCGYGHRVFEVAKFSSSLISHKSKNDKIKSFIDGYESVRKLSNTEKSTIPYFEIASIIWVMSIHVSNIDKIGYKYLEEPFWSNRISRIEDIEVDLV